MVVNVLKQINPSNGCVVVAHPDDEVCWFGGLILKTINIKWHIICCSYPSNLLEVNRRYDFARACSYIGLPCHYIDKPEPHCRLKLDRLAELRALDLARFDVVVTHGNYGHQHHRSIHRQVVELYGGPIICSNPNGKFSLRMDDALYDKKMQWLKNYKTNSVKIDGRDVEKWEALLYYHKSVRSKIERYDVLNTNKTLNTYNRSWKLTKGVECDIHLADYLTERNAKNKIVFHFGTGAHHKLGKMATNNIVLGITASAEEYNIYMKEIKNDPSLAKRYKVLFGDIYLLNPELLPQFDIVSLFHLCEYSRGDSDYGQMTDLELLRMFVNKLTPNGLLCFFVGSNHYREANKLVSEFINDGSIKMLETYKSIVICEKNGREC